jgi:4-hydroxy-2-oxoheptanedioate aldolase
VAAGLIRERLTAGEAVFGCLLRFPDAGLAEYLALLGFDLIVFDGEHGPLSPHLCEHLVRAVQLHHVTPLVRVEENREATILRYLDTGALGCHIPGVASGEAAARAVHAAKFHPEGGRGLAGSRSSGYGLTDYPSYLERSNRQTLIVAHIENAAGVAEAEAIAATDGIDVLFFGAVDLSHDLGIAGEIDHPEIRAAAESVAAATRAAGKTFGVMARDTADAKKWLAHGARYILTPIEAWVRPGIQQYLAQARA